MRSHLFLAALLAVAAPLAASERQLVLDPGGTEVTFDLEATGHDVHGLVALRSGEIRFDSDSGTASGEVVLDATVAETGSSSRDKTLRNDVFEVAKFPEIRFTPARIEGSLPASGKGRLTLHGAISLHGAAHPLALPADVTVEGDRVEATAKATIPYQDWGLRDPSILFLRVARVVSISIHLRGELSVVDATAKTGGR